MQFQFASTNIGPGLSVIEASAGTGKTFAISHLVPRLLAERAVESIGQILLVTYTNDAARELSERVRRVLEGLAAPAWNGEANQQPGIHELRNAFDSQEHQACFQRALAEIDQLSVSTIHSFCKRTIDQEGTLCGVPASLEVITDAGELIEEVVYQVWQEHIVANEQMAKKAAKDGWSVENDVAFIKQALALEEFEPVPPSKAPGIFTACMHFDENKLLEVEQFFCQEQKWNKAADGSSKHLASIRQARGAGFNDTLIDQNKEFWKALEWLSDLADCVPAKGSGDLKERAKELPAVKEAQKWLLKREPTKSHSQASVLWYWQHHCLELVRARIIEALRKKRQITQDGLITTLRDALRSPMSGPKLAERLRERYKVILIDESQDTDPTQFEIFRTFLGSNEHRLVLIGDPKQAIYAFRGADVDTYLAARNQATATGVQSLFSLSATYRSSEPLVKAINAFFSRENAFLKEALTFIPAVSKKEDPVTLSAPGGECPVEAWVVAHEHAEAYSSSVDRQKTIARTVASKIVELLNSAKKQIADGPPLPVLPSDFAVLTSRKSQADGVAQELKARGVPAVVITDKDVLESEEAFELLCLLRALQTPRRSKLRYSALATRFFGKTDVDLQAIREGNDGQDEAFITQLMEWRVAWEKKGIAHAIALADEQYQLFVRLAKAGLGERRVTNLRQLIDLLQTACDSHARRPEELLRWFEQEIRGASENSAPEERQLRLENDGKAVQVLTMHKAKGLEFEFVFCPYLWDMGPNKGRHLKLPKAGGSTTPRLVHKDLAKDLALEISRNRMEDRLRLAYVAMTRAKTKLWLYAGHVAGENGASATASALDWLLRGSQDEQRLEEFSQAWLDSSDLKLHQGTRHAAGLEALNSAGQLIAICPPPPITEQQWHPDSEQSHMAQELVVLAAPTVPHYWRVTSFSALSREKNRHGSKEAPGADRQEGGQNVNAFADAPGSALIGDVIHKWLEDWDFSANPSATEISVHLRKHPLVDEELAAESVADMCSHLREAVLPGLECTIGQACASAQASEWNFHLPLNRYLSTRDLVQAFAECKEERFRHYAEALGGLSPNAVSGYLQGFVDRIAVNGERCGLIDWKTNKLGKAAESYEADGLWACAVDHHYLLQVCLYLVALRRFVRRLGKPDASIAGAWLVLLRGVQSGSSRGVLHIDPPTELLERLDSLFTKP